MNVAGTSQYLDPSGKDVLGINMPLKEFQAGTFETTYLDKDLRISRGQTGSIEQLRVFVKGPEEFGVQDEFSDKREEAVEAKIVEEEEEDDDFGNPDPDPGFEI